MSVFHCEISECRHGRASNRGTLVREIALEQRDRAGAFFGIETYASEHLPDVPAQLGLFDLTDFIDQALPKRHEQVRPRSRQFFYGIRCPYAYDGILVKHRFEQFVKTFVVAQYFRSDRVRRADRTPIAADEPVG